MSPVPSCDRLGRQCRELRLTLRIADFKEDGPELRDAAATWLLGHTERISFARPFVRDHELLVEATVHVPCKYLTNDEGAERGRSVHPDAEARAENQGNGRMRRPRVRCAAHGFRGPLPRGSRPENMEPACHAANGKYSVVYRGKSRALELPLKRAARHSLPVLRSSDPCATAPCRTGDNRKGAACCRDLTMDIVLPRRERRLETFLRSRKSPFLCKVTREDDNSVEAEIISACRYLQDDGIGCNLHDRLLPNGRLAKPSICREWPDLDEDEIAHPGCVLA